MAPTRRHEAGRQDGRTHDIAGTRPGGTKPGGTKPRALVDGPAVAVGGREPWRGQGARGQDALGASVVMSEITPNLINTVTYYVNPLQLLACTLSGLLCVCLRGGGIV